MRTYRWASILIALLALLGPQLGQARAGASAALPDGRASRAPQAAPQATAAQQTASACGTPSLKMAGDFNIFVLGSLSLQTTSTQGRIAAGGSATFQSYSVGTALPQTSTARDVLVAGTVLTYTNGTVGGGNVVYGTSASLTGVTISQGTARRGSALDFADASQYLKRASNNWGKLAATGSTVVQPRLSSATVDIKLEGSDPRTNIFAVKGDDLARAGSLTVKAPGGSTVLVNISGTRPQIQGFGTVLSGITRQSVLYNFYEATQLQIGTIGVEGSVLAPLAAVAFGGKLYGTLVAGSLSGSGAAQWHQFTGCLPTPMITGVSLDKAQVCAGENIQVLVKAQHPDAVGKPVAVAVNGNWGPSQVLQFSGSPGQRVIQITAMTDEKYIDTKELRVNLIACSPSAEYPILRSGPNPYQENSVDFTVRGVAADRPAPTYVWDFGDGTSAQTSVPAATHFYGKALQRDQLQTTFQVSVRLTRAGQADTVVRKTLTLQNAYAFNKERGFIQPPVEGDRKLTISGSNFVGSYSIHNLEDSPIQITGRQLEYNYCDSSQQSALPQQTETLQLTVGSGQRLVQKLVLPVASVAENFCSVLVGFTGKDAVGRPVYASLSFDIRTAAKLEQPVDPALAQVLNQAATRGLLRDRVRSSEEELYRLSREGKISYTPGPADPALPATPTPAPTATPAPTPTPSSGADIIGRRCSFGNPAQGIPADPSPRPGIVCSPTGEWTAQPPRIANAYKGDIILSPGCGPIGSLLRQVAPRQGYTHTGMMIEDHTRIRHSTASSDRIMDEDYLVGSAFDGSKGTDGFREDIVRYAWPGTISESVDQAFNGHFLVDPENGKSYKFKSFSSVEQTCDGDVAPSYPRVVSPPPGSDSAVRQKLWQAADAAKTINGHYRFFAYSDASVATNSAFNAPSSMLWFGRNPTLATVCSSFIWAALKSVGVTLEGARLEDADVAQGAERDASTADGLYLYREAERMAAGAWLYQYVYDKAYEKGGILGSALYDAPDDAATQMANCFGSDRCGEKDEPYWRHPGVGRAVSPDNIFFWDAPADGGVYGYNTRLEYRGAEYTQRGTWQADPTVGKLTGRVLFNGAPFAGAAVRITRSGSADVIMLASDASGSFSDDLLPAGTYVIEARGTSGGVPLSKQVTVSVTAGATTNVSIALQIEPDFVREVRLIGSMFLLDDEVLDDEQGSFNINEGWVLDPLSRREMDIKLGGHGQYCAGGEVRVEIYLHLRLEADNRTVTASGDTRLFEGTSCSTDDREDLRPFSFTLAPGSSTPLSTRLNNSGAGGGDWAQIDLTLTNTAAR